MVFDKVDRVALMNDVSHQLVSIVSSIDIVRFIAMRISEKWTSPEINQIFVRDVFLQNRCGWNSQKNLNTHTL